MMIVPTRLGDWLERAAMSASMLCLVHCLALPLLLALLPALGIMLRIPESFHLWVFLFAVPASGTALVAGRATHHGWRPLLWGTLGLALLGAGVLLLEASAWETPFTVAGSLLLAIAHIGNWRLRHATCHI